MNRDDIVKTEDNNVEIFKIYFYHPKIANIFLCNNITNLLKVSFWGGKSLKPLGYRGYCMGKMISKSLGLPHSQLVRGNHLCGNNI